MTPTQVNIRASIIIVNFNSGDDLSRCLESLYKSNLPNDEIIVVDNASTDCSIENIRDNFSKVCCITSPTNLGFGGACNLASRYGMGKYLAFLNPDTTVTPGWLDAMIAVLDANPKVGLVTPKILLLHTPERINTCGNDVHISGLTLCRGMESTKNEFNQIEPVGAVSGATFVIRKELFAALGGFDESFFLYMEDTDLSWRARLAGRHILYVPQAIIFHDYKLCFCKRKIFYQERNRYCMLLKCLQWRTLLVLLPALVLGEAVTWGFCLLHNWSGMWEKCHAYIWLAANLPKIMKARRQTQTLRRVCDEVLISSTGYRLMFEQPQDGPVARLAHQGFDPLFAICKAIALWGVKRG